MQYWNIANRNKLQWNFNHTWCIFIQENAFENVVWKMAAILALPQYFESLRVFSASQSLLCREYTTQFISPHRGSILQCLEALFAVAVNKQLKTQVGWWYQTFADTLFDIQTDCIAWIFIKISVNFVPKCPINNSPALVQIMGWRRPGDKPLSEPMMVTLLMYKHHSASMS